MLRARRCCFLNLRTYATGPEGYYLHGWEKQFKFLSTKWEKVSLADRIAQVMWRGRTMDKEFPNRDELRCCSLEKVSAMSSAC